MCLLIWTVFSGERCGPWASCFGLTYLAHVCLIIRECVAYINDPNTMLTFDLKVKFTGFLTFFMCPAYKLLSFDLTLTYYIWHMRLSPWEDVSCTFMIWIHINLWPQGQTCRVYYIVCGFVFRPQLTQLYYVWHVSVSPW